jgi:hypothetical protein
MHASLRAPWWHHAALGVLALLYVGHAMGFGDWLVDDAGITFAYSQRLARGLPLAVNLGEAPVEGYSNPAWMFVVAGVDALGLFSVPLVPKLLGGLFVWLSMGLAWWTSRHSFGDPDGPQHLIPPALLAVIATYVQWSVSGLENAMFSWSMLATLAARVVDRAHPDARGAGVATGLLTMTVLLGRPEGMAYAAIVGLEVAVTALRTGKLRPLVGWSLGFGGPLLVYAAWHAHTFLDPLPNTFYAKVAEGRGLGALVHLDDPGNRYVRGAFSTYGLYWAPLALAAPLLAARRWFDAGGLALHGMVAVSVAFGAYSAGDWMPGHRLMTPVYPLLGLATAGAITLAPRLDARARAIVTALVLALTLAWAPKATPAAWKSQGMKLLVQLKTLDAFAKMATVLGERPLVVGLPDLGGPAMTTDDRFVIVDLFGLVDRDVAHLLRQADRVGREPLWTHLFEERKVDVLRMAEANWSRWRFGESKTFKQEFWLIVTSDTRSPPRHGTWIRRDLVEGNVPADLTPAAIAPGVEAAARLSQGSLRVWWVVRTDQEALPAMRVKWSDAAGKVIETTHVRAYDAAFPPTLFKKGRTLREDLRTPAPAGAVGFELLGA